MQLRIFNACVRNGRLVLDEPVDSTAESAFPPEEGEVIELISLDSLLVNGGALSEDDERGALDRAIEKSISEAKEGHVYDFSEALAAVRAKQSDGSTR